MNISKLTLLQKDLDAVVNKNHPIKKGEDRVANKFNALVVELAEFANEGRWFKFWSRDREPRHWKYDDDCSRCDGKGVRLDRGTMNFWECDLCHGTGEVTNNGDPLLEEYIDSLHFFISIAIDMGWDDALYIQEEPLLEFEENGFTGGLTGAFNEVIYHLMKSYMEKHPEDEIIAGYQANQYSFRLAWGMFVAIGLVGFQFSDEAIEAAYMIKNKENHSRQQNGY